MSEWEQKRHKRKYKQKTRSDQSDNFNPDFGGMISFTHNPCSISTGGSCWRDHTPPNSSLRVSMSLCLRHLGMWSFASTSFSFASFFVFSRRSEHACVASVNIPYTCNRWYSISRLVFVFRATKWPDSYPTRDIFYSQQRSRFSRNTLPLPPHFQGQKRGSWKSSWNTLEKSVV